MKRLKMKKSTVEIPLPLWKKMEEEAHAMGLTPVQLLRVILSERYAEETVE